MKILVVKFDDSNWDMVSESGSFAYSYRDDELQFIKVHFHDQHVDKPMLTYEGLLEYSALEDVRIKEYFDFETMSAEVFESVAEWLTGKTQPFEVISRHISKESEEKEAKEIAKALINEFLFGKTQKAPCEQCAKEQVYYIDESQVKCCTECRAPIVLEGE